MPLWNPWHGCTKCSFGCQNCYVYRRDAEFGKDASIVKKTASFNLPVKKDRHGNYKLKPEDPFPGIPVCKSSSAFRARRSRIIAHNIKNRCLRCFSTRSLIH